MLAETILIAQGNRCSVAVQSTFYQVKGSINIYQKTDI